MRKQTHGKNKIFGKIESMSNKSRKMMGALAHAFDLSNKGAPPRAVGKNRCYPHCGCSKGIVNALPSFGPTTDHLMGESRRLAK